MEWQNYSLPIGKRTIIMGILNVTPDSFSGDGITDVDEAVKKAEKFVEEGADIIDIGGESTRPYATPVSQEEELKRVIPVIKKLKDRINIPISIDTYKSRVAKEALEVGASMVNNIGGLRFDEKVAQVVKEFEVPIILMHIKGEPKTMQDNPQYDDVISEIKTYLQNSIDIAKKYGVSEDKIIIDPGIGFGKTLEHNLIILRRLKEFKSLNKPILIGTSRKSLIGKVLNLPIDERLEGTAATIAVAIVNGCDIVRVHDVKEMKRVTVMTDAIVRGYYV